MKALVCDSCGKVTMLGDKESVHNATGMHHLYCDSSLFPKAELDLCDECANKLIDAVRKEGEKNVQVTN